MFSLESYGLEQLQNVMSELPAEVTGPVGRKAAVKAARPLVRSAKATTVFADQTRNLRRGIRVRQATARDRRRYNRAPKHTQHLSLIHI